MPVSDHAAIARGLRDAPLDVARRRVYADALEDAGQAKRAQFEREVAAVLGLPANADLAARAAAAVEWANRKLRRRTVTLRQALRCCAQAVCRHVAGEMPAFFADGGSDGITTMYGNSSAQTALVLAVVRVRDGRVCVAGGTSNTVTNKGGSPASAWSELIQWRPGPNLAARLQQWAKSH